MSARTYGPDATWPTHQKPYWNKALAEARMAGWTLTYLDAPHTFGSVACPTAEHSFRVDKTAKGGETKAREAAKKVRLCSHGTAEPGSKVSLRQRECVQLLEVAKALINFAEEGLIAAEAKQAAQEELDRLELQIGTAAANISEVLLAEQESALLEAMEVDQAPEPEMISATLNDARDRVRQGESLARLLSSGRPKLAEPLLLRAHEAYARIDGLSARLAGLRERTRS